VDGKALRFGEGGAGLSVIGAGGGLVHTGLTPYERRDAELVSAFEDALHALDYRKKDHPILVALSHTPPFGTEADLRHGSHTGSKGLRALLDAMEPALWVCGHIHEARSVSRSGRSLVVNPGSLREGFYAKVKAESRGEGRDFEAELLRL
jgi:Icc-related predicted phosphoesterase